MKKQINLIALTILTATFAESADLRPYERQIIASCMVLEAGGEGLAGMQAVLNVILNRSEGYLHRMVPETINHGAFSCMAEVWHTPTPDYSPLISRAQNQSEAYRKAMRLIVTMERGMLWDNTYGATHYHADTIRPYWVSDMRYITTIGDHHFYSEAPQQVASL